MYNSIECRRDKVNRYGELSLYTFFHTIIEKVFSCHLCYINSPVIDYVCTYIFFLRSIIIKSLYITNNIKTR